MDLKLDRGTLEALRDATFAASTDDFRPVLCAVELVVTRDRVTVRATDSYLFAQRSAKIEAPEALTVLLPAKPLREAIAVALKDRHATTFAVKLTELGATIEHSAGSAMIQSTEGRFPDIAAIMAGYKPGPTESIALSPWRVEQLGRALGVEKLKKNEAGNNNHALLIELAGPDKMARVRKASEFDPEHNFGLIMPVRTGC